jgi:dTDP-4-amino-4,6-dideoxygalactose transaminase
LGGKVTKGPSFPCDPLRGVGYVASKRIGPAFSPHYSNVAGREKDYRKPCVKSTSQVFFSIKIEGRPYKPGASSSMQIPLMDLHARYQAIKYGFAAAFEEVLEKMQLFRGPQLQAFKSVFAAYCCCHYGVGLSSGTGALALAFRASGIGPGDEVVTVAITFIATVEAIALVGAKPIFVDVDPDTYTMDWRQLDQVLTPRICALLPIHLYGHPAEMQPVLEFARAHGLRVIGDASQLHGVTYRGRRVGGFGDIGCFRLYYSKNLGAYGEVGICVTCDHALAENLRKLRDHGSRVRYRHEVLVVNARLDELQAAVLRVKLCYLDQWNATRLVHEQAYTEQVRELGVEVPFIQSWGTHMYCYYVVQVQRRDKVCKVLEQEEIATAIPLTK